MTAICPYMTLDMHMAKRTEWNRCEKNCCGYDFLDYFQAKEKV